MSYKNRIKSDIRTGRRILSLGLVLALCLPVAPQTATAGINPGKALGSAAKKGASKKSGAKGGHRAGQGARRASAGRQRGASPGPRRPARSSVAPGTRGGPSKPQRAGIKIREGKNSYSSAGPLGKRPAPNTRTAQPGKSILKKPPQRGRLGPNGVTQAPARGARSGAQSGPEKGKKAVRQVIRPASPTRTANGRPSAGKERATNMAAGPSDLKRYQSRKERGDTRKLKSLKKLKSSGNLAGSGKRIATRGSGKAYAPDNTKKLKKVANKLKTSEAGTSGSRLKKVQQPKR